MGRFLMLSLFGALLMLGCSKAFSKTWDRPWEEDSMEEAFAEGEDPFGEGLPSMPMTMPGGDPWDEEPLPFDTEDLDFDFFDSDDDDDEDDDGIDIDKVIEHCMPDFDARKVLRLLNETCEKMHQLPTAYEITDLMDNSALSNSTIERFVKQFLMQFGSITGFRPWPHHGRGGSGGRSGWGGHGRGGRGKGGRGRGGRGKGGHGGKSRRGGDSEEGMGGFGGKWHGWGSSEESGERGSGRGRDWGHGKGKGDQYGGKSGRWGKHGKGKSWGGDDDSGEKGRGGDRKGGRGHGKGHGKGHRGGKSGDRDGGAGKSGSIDLKDIINTLGGLFKGIGISSAGPPGGFGGGFPGFGGNSGKGGNKFPGFGGKGAGNEGGNGFQFGKR